MRQVRDFQWRDPYGIDAGVTFVSTGASRSCCVAAIATLMLLGSCFLARPRPGYAPPPKLEDTIDARKCITDPSGYAKLKGQASGDAGFREGALPWDLDGDGQGDTFVRVAGRPSTIFASNRGCVRDLGDVQGTIIDAGKDKSEGFRSLITFVGAGCSGLAGKVYEWSMRDGALQPQALATCGCPDLTRPDPNRHPVCPALRPR